MMKPLAFAWMRGLRRVALLVLPVLGACTSLPAPTGIDGAACAGGVPQAVPGLQPAEDSALLAMVRLAAGKGGVCAGSVFEVTRPMVVHRVFDSRYPQAAMGRWWTFDAPRGSRDAYRSRFAICPEWSQLDRVITCNLKVGTRLVIGSTQSARCEDGLYAAQPDLQVYVPNDNMRDRFWVEACSPPVPWPAETAAR